MRHSVAAAWQCEAHAPHTVWPGRVGRRARPAWHTACVLQGVTDAPWTCPFCSLLCDSFAVDVSATGHVRLRGSDCPRAQAGLSQFHAQVSRAVPTLRGTPIDLDGAVTTAAQWLAASHLPLLGGLATDVAGARALYHLAARLNAICDHAHGEALHLATRAMQDRGVFYTTLAEVRNRADLIVCVGTSPTEHYPEFFRRCGVGSSDLVAQRHVAFVGAAADTTLSPHPALSSEAVELQGDLFDTLALLDALVAQRRIRVRAPALEALAERLRQARYAVLVWEPARLPPQGALLAEALQRLVATLNQYTRAASLALGGSDGAYTAQQVHTWLSGLPLRTHASAGGLEHDPLRFGTRQLLADGAVDSVLWVGSFGPEPAPPATQLPLIVLAHPQTKAPPGNALFIPVATPGIGADGHLFRTDGGVVLPLRRVYDDGLPTVADVVARIDAALEAA